MQITITQEEEFEIQNTFKSEGARKIVRASMLKKKLALQERKPIVILPVPSAREEFIAFLKMILWVKSQTSE